MYVLASRSMERRAVENVLLVKCRASRAQAVTPEPKHISGPSGLSTHKPATQASIRPRKTGFGLIHAYKEVVCLVVEVYFVNSE